MRTGASEIQANNVEDCAHYVINRATYLAFGYGIKWHGATFACDHRKCIDARQRRTAQDLMNRGFTHYMVDNEQYYTVRDTPPTAWRDDGWRPLDEAILQGLEDSSTDGHHMNFA